VLATTSYFVAKPAQSRRFSVAEGLFTYEGFSGLWACSIYVNATQAETFHGSADISFRGKFAARLFLACRDRLPL